MNRLPKRNRRLFLGTSFVNSLVASDANSTYADANSSLIATTFLGELTDSMWEERKDAAPNQLSTLDQAINRIVYAGDSFDEPSQNGALRSGRLAVERILQATELQR